MNEDFEPAFDDDLKEEVARFEAMLRKNEEKFFDVAQIEEIVDYYLREGELTWAERALNLGLSQHPFAPELKLRLAQLYSRKGKFRDALRELNEAGHLDTANADILLFKAEIYSELQDYDKSIECFEKALEVTDKEDQDFILIDIASEYQNKGDFENARKYLKMAILNNPVNDLAYLEFLFTMQIEEKIEEAEAFFQSLIDTDPYNAMAWYYLGLTYQDMELYEKSVESFDFAITIKDDFVEAYIQKAESYISLSLYEQAIKPLKEALQLTDAFVRIYYTLGECYENLEDYATAFDYYQQTVTINAEIGDGWFGMAICSGQMGKYQDALLFTNKCLDIAPENIEYKLANAVYLSHLGHFGTAEEIFEEIKEKYPENPDVWIDYGEMYFRLDDPATAVAVTFEGLKYHPDHADLFYRLSGYLHYLGNRKESLEMLHSALTLDYEGHKEFLNAFSDLENDPEILELIQKSAPHEY